MKIIIKYTLLFLIDTYKLIVSPVFILICGVSWVLFWSQNRLEDEEEFFKVGKELITPYYELRKEIKNDFF